MPCEMHYGGYPGGTPSIHRKPCLIGRLRRAGFGYRPPAADPSPSAVMKICAALVLASTASSAAAPLDAKPPNFVFVLADDLNWDYKQDRQAIMPTLKKELADGGLYFYNHVAAYPVCGPSRSSMLAGRYAHNTGYVANAAPASVAAWSKIQNDTVGTWMTKAGYYTAFLGKYVNGMECDVPSGWRHWGGLTCPVLHRPGQPVERLGGTYNYMNA
eukprot:gene10935-1986_t